MLDVHVTSPYVEVTTVIHPEMAEGLAKQGVLRMEKHNLNIVLVLRSQ